MTWSPPGSRATVAPGGISRPSAGGRIRMTPWAIVIAWISTRPAISAA